MSGNWSGFVGYPYASIYPNFGGVTQTQETAPEPAEQAVISTIDNQASPNINKRQKLSIWIVFAMIILIVIIAGKVGG